MNVIKKIGLKNAIYIGLFLITLIFFSVMCAWAAADTSSADVEIIDAEVLLGENVRHEYLVGEEIAKDGIMLSVEGKNVSEISLACDTSSAGLKKVEVSYQKDNLYYHGYFTVNVFSVRHYDVRNTPEIYKDENGELRCGEIEIWVELNAKPTEFVTVGDYDTTIALPSYMYETEVKRDDSDESEYSLDIKCTSATLNYYYVDIGSGIIMLDSKNRVLEFTNMNVTRESIKLYVTQCGNNAEGYYVFTAQDGDKTVLRFSYYLEGYTSHFTSSSFNEGVTEAQVGDDYEVTYNGITFRADANSWHRAILNW